MTELTTFTNDTFGEVRTITREGEPWFVAADVCEFFGVTNRNRALQQLEEDEKGGTQIDTPGGVQTVTIINESGLYTLLFYLQPKKARGISEEKIEERCELLRRYKRWITHDVIPAIRKSGAYLTPETAYKVLSDPQSLIQMLTTLKDEHDKRMSLEADNRKLADAVEELSEDNRLLREENHNRAVQVLEYSAKAMYADDVIEAGNNTCIRETAKLLGVKETDFVKLLIEKRYLYRAPSNNRLLPYDNRKARGVFTVKEYTHKNGFRIGIHTLVTPRGRMKLLAECVKAGLVEKMPEENSFLWELS